MDMEIRDKGGLESKMENVVVFISIGFDKRRIILFNLTNFFLYLFKKKI